MRIEKRCKWCGKAFVAQKLTTLYCSPSCNNKCYKQRKRQEHEAQTLHESVTSLPIVASIGDKPFLSVTEAAVLLGISRASIYRYMASGAIKALQLKAKTIIRRKDLDKMFDAAPAYKHRSYGRKEESQYYTMREICEKYNISKKAARGRLERNGIQAIYEGRNCFYNKNAVDVKFAELLDEVNLANYYTSEEIAEKYGMSKGAVLAFVMRHNIPRVKKLRKVYYAKSHIDHFKGSGDALDPENYTYAEIQERYGFTKDQVGYYLRNYPIESFKRGKFTMIPRAQFDKIMQKRMNGTLVLPKKPQKEKQSKPQEVFVVPDGYASAEQIAELYGISAKHTHKVARENNVPCVTHKHFKYYELASVEIHFAKYKSVEVENTQWLTSEEVEQSYHMTPNARRSFMYRHKIPTKRVKGVVCYSKTHIGDAKNTNSVGDEEYLSVDDLMVLYGVTRTIIYNQAKYHKISRQRKGQYTFFSVSEFDKVMKGRNSLH